MTQYVVSSGYTSGGLFLSAGEEIQVMSGGTAFAITLSSGGGMTVYNGGSAYEIYVSSSGVDAVWGSASNTVVYSGGVEDVEFGGTVTSTTVLIGGTVSVLSGGTDISTILSGGYQFVFPGGTAIGTVVNLLGQQIDDPGGTASGTIVNAGGAEYVFGSAISTTVRGGGLQEVQLSGTAIGTLVNDGGSQLVHGGTASGTIIDSGGALEIVGGAVYSGSVTVLAASGMVSGAVLSGGTEIVSSGGIADDTVVSSAGSEVVSFGGSAIDTTVVSGGAIDVTYLSYVAGGTASVTSSDMLTISVGGQTYAQQLSGNYADEHFRLAQDTNSGTLITLQCYRSGTRILTDRGEVAVEDLHVGDLVRTLLGDATAPIIWIGRREVDCARHPRPRKVWPVCVAAGAFGSGLPHSDLWLSPDHAVYVNEVLIPIRHLINASTITQVPVDHVSYYHIELPQHDVVLAEGLPAESFLDMRDGSNYANRPGPIRLYPDYTPKIWEAFGCARLVVTGPELEAARALVMGFARQQKAA